MPVWHEKTRTAREAGTLAVVGITQEQHPERCRLFAQWHGLDWPILWDPFNRTGSKAVPNFTLIDEHGRVYATRARPAHLEAFLAETASPADPPAGHDAEAAKDAPWTTALRGLLAERDADPTPHLAVLAAKAGSDAARLFQLGVAYRMRFDSPFAIAGDFQAALTHWQTALAARPDQYIWRRRIQQYGPRSEKPYPFYDWVTRADKAIRARGDTPVALRVPLTETERHVWPGKQEAEAAHAPDPEGRLPRTNPAGEAVVTIETAVALDTRGASWGARLHLRVSPIRARAAWNAEAGPVGLWVAPNLSEVPTPVGADDTSGSTAPVDLELDVPTTGTTDGVLEGYVLCPLCLADGTCLTVRADFRARVDGGAAGR